MSNERRRETEERLGFDSQEERRLQEESIERERKRREAAEQVSERIRQSTSYRVLIKGALGFDILDAVLGIFETFGDLFSFVVGWGYLYISAFVVRHFRLTMAVFFVLLVDLLIGLIPFAGTVVDVVFPASYICRGLIQGVVDHDKQKIKMVNMIFMAGFIIVAVLVVLVLWLLTFSYDVLTVG
ncbi:MAG: DUF4112 domain-containing protein [Paludibacteraceae bacterium]|nr:DUF4112 domain-containing protein [Paludibacteraceae bacterium]MBR4839693.1 DUF4112 domain-containing protein [Paludibacteraceae bacterium]